MVVCVVVVCVVVVCNGVSNGVCNGVSNGVCVIRNINKPFAILKYGERNTLV